jgi:hypothetical protein
MNKYIIIAIFFVLTACSVGDDEKNQFVVLPITSVDIPTSFKKDSISNFVLRYKRPTDCHIFNGVYYEAVGNERHVGINAVRLLENNCQPENLTEFEVPLQFKPLETGVYVFKFITAIDATGTQTYQTNSILVE